MECHLHRYIDITTAHHLFRSVPSGCGWLGALRLVSASLNSNMRLLLPPPPPSQMAQSNLPAPSQMVQSNLPAPSQIAQSNLSLAQSNYVERLVEIFGGGPSTPSQTSQSNLSAPRGWVGVSGVKGSGKTIALLQACHILATQAQGLAQAQARGQGHRLTQGQGQGLAPGQGLGLGQAQGLAPGQGSPTSSGPPSRDFVWIDLAGVSSDMEVISRVAQQLGLDQQVVSLSDGSHFTTLPSNAPRSTT